MKTAEEMFNLTNHYKEEFKKNIYTQIEESAREGNYSFISGVRFEKDFENELQSNGFKIQYIGSGCRVSWEDAKKC